MTNSDATNSDPTNSATTNDGAPQQLAAEEIAGALVDLPDWRLDDGELVAAFRFPAFAEAFGFMTSAAIVAERMNHHPDWSNSYNVVTVRLTTHDAGGVTSLDIELASAMSRFAAAAVA